ncbi:hypothetical protein AB0K48_06340 [Nonomuraea sp. NPDC055795]
MLTVGELVAFIELDRSDFKRGTVEVARDLAAMQGSTSKATLGMESSITRTLNSVARELGEAFDPAEALVDIHRLTSGLVHELDSVEGEAGQAGRRAGAAFVEEAREMLRYGEFDVDIGADVSRAIAVLAAVAEEAERAGARAGDGFIRGADGRLRDARGRFVAEGTAMFDGLVDGAERAGAETGRALESGLGVIGKAGPANVALAAVAIDALPTVASVAAGGIVAALGGGLLAVGLVNAATADDVQRAWKDAVDEIKSEMQDAAQPLEGSAIRAADVAERVFDRLKPSLKRIFRDLVPDVDLFIARVGEGVGSLGPTMERLGDSFGGVLSELGQRMPAIIDNVSATLDKFAEIANEDPQMLANVIEDASELLRIGAEVLSWADEIKAVLTLPIAPQNSGNLLFEYMFGGSPEEIMTDLEKLPQIMDQVKISLAAGATVMVGVGDAGGDAASGVRSLSAALEEMFDPAAAALDAEIRLKDALKGAADAAKDGRMSLLDRLRAVQDTTRAIAEAAKTESENTGKTTEAGNAYLDNIGKLREWAGQNKSARDTVAGLGESLGITTVKTKSGTFAIDALGKAVQILPNGKTIEVDADTAAGKKQLAEINKKIDDTKGKTVKVDADTKGAVTEVGKVKTGLDGLPKAGQQAGKDLGAGLASGIRSMIGDAVAAAKSLAQSALQGAKDLLGIRSPSTEMAEVGRWTVRGLIQGLTDEEGRAVDTVRQMIEKIKAEFAKTPETKDHLLAFVSQGNDSLLKLAKEREELVAKLAAAKEMAKTIAGDAKEWASITGLSEEELNAGDFSGALKNRAQAIKDFANDIKTLAARGLNKETLRQIIEAGVDGGASIAEMLVGADGSEIKAINKAQKQIDNMSKKLGKSGADALYDVGKKAGDGYLKGLQDSLKKLDAEMTKIVKALVSAIKRELKIKSPSQVMMEIGEYAMAGLDLGLVNGAGKAIATMTGVADQIATQATGSLGRMVTGMQPGGPVDASVATAGGRVGGSASTGLDGVPQQPGPSGVTVNIENAYVREEADIHRIGSDIGFDVMAQGLV